MTQRVRAILDSALALSADEQGELVSALVSVLDERGVRPFDDEALAEIERRSSEYDAGRVTPIPWNTAKERARAELQK